MTFVRVFQKKSSWLILLIFFVVSDVSAQQAAIKKIAADCSIADLRKNLFYLASDQLEGRQTQTHGDTLTAIYVADWFKKHNISAPYNSGKSYFQAVVAEKITTKPSLSFAGKTFDLFDNWSLYPGAPVALKDVEILYSNLDNFPAILTTLENGQGNKKALLVNGNAIVPTLRDGSIDSIETVLAKRGVVAVIWSDPIVYKTLNAQKGRSFLPRFVIHLPGETMAQGFPEVAITPDLLKNLLKTNDIDPENSQPITTTLKNKISVLFDTTLQKVEAPNIIGVINGSDPSLAPVVVGAHHDHDGRDGEKIYYGAVDNASGTVALMQMAAMMNEAVKKGIRPKRSVVFASFTGEERGLLGSGWYVDHPVFPEKKTFAMLNVDMLGRVDTIYNKRSDSNYAYIMVVDSLKLGLRDRLQSANKNGPNLLLDTRYEEPQHFKRGMTGSDQYNFFLKGIPVAYITCGFCKDYHQPTDTPDKINYDLLKKQTQLAFLTLWNMADGH